MADGFPLVSIIMPTYNHANFISESLDSLIEQSYQNWECIIVDDGSTDATEKVIEKYILDKRILYFKKHNEGTSIAKNFGVERSKGVYLLPLDADDYIHEAYLEKAVNMLLRDNKLRIVYCEAELFGEKHGKWELPVFDYKLIFIYNMIFNSALFYREDFDIIGGYDCHSLLEDWDLWMNILKKGGKVYQIPEVLFYYRIHEEGSVTNKLREEGGDYKSAMNRLYKNNMDEYMKVIGNPIELERERRALESILKRKDYELALQVVNHPLFKFFRVVRNYLKKIFGAKKY